MDNEVFRKTYRDVNELSCVYEKSILTNQCDCDCARRFCIAEREGVRCTSGSAREQCLELLERLRDQSRFTLRLSDERLLLPHGKAIRIQVGGLRGLYLAVHPEAATAPQRIEGVSALIAAARESFHGLANLPFSEIIRQVAGYRGRRRSRGRG